MLLPVARRAEDSRWHSRDSGFPAPEQKRTTHWVQLPLAGAGNGSPAPRRSHGEEWYESPEKTWSPPETTPELILGSTCAAECIAAGAGCGTSNPWRRTFSAKCSSRQTS